MTAAAQVFANYSDAIPHSGSVPFFRSTPRWPSAPSSFAFSTDYLTPIALTALLPLFFALVLVVFLLIHIIVRFSCRNRTTNARLLKRHDSPRTTYILVPLSAMLLTLILVFTSIGLLGNATLNHSANDALDVFTSLVNDISRSGFAVVDTAVLLQERLQRFDPALSSNSSVLSESVGDLITPTLAVTKQFILDRYPNVSPLQTTLNELRENILDVFEVVRNVVNILYGVLLGIIIVVLSALPLLRLATARSATRICSVIAYLLYLFIPAILAWVLVGVLSAVGATVGDVCGSLSEYREVLRSVNDSNTYASNPFVMSGFVCPTGISAETLQRQIDDTALSVMESRLARSTIQLLLGTPAEQIAETANWTSTQLPRYLDCSAQVVFTGQLEFLMCGSAAHSAIDGIWSLWIAFIALAVGLSVAIFASLMGLHIMRCVDVWPYADHDGAMGGSGEEHEEAEQAMDRLDSQDDVGGVVPP